MLNLFNLQAQQQASITQAEVSSAAGKAAAAWAQVEVMESKGDAAGAAASAAEAVALQQQAQQCQAAAEAAAVQAHHQVTLVISRHHTSCVVLGMSSGQLCASLGGKSHWDMQHTSQLSSTKAYPDAPLIFHVMIASHHQSLPVTAAMHGYLPCMHAGLLCVCSQGLRVSGTTLTTLCTQPCSFMAKKSGRAGVTQWADGCNKVEC